MSRNSILNKNWQAVLVAPIVCSVPILQLHVHLHTKFISLIHTCMHVPVFLGTIHVFTAAKRDSLTFTLLHILLLKIEVHVYVFPVAMSAVK